MRRLLDSIIVIIILAIVVKGLLAMVEPYAPYIVLAGLLFLGGSVAWRYYRNW